MEAKGAVANLEVVGGRWKQHPDKHDCNGCRHKTPRPCERCSVVPVQQKHSALNHCKHVGNISALPPAPSQWESNGMQSQEEALSVRARGGPTCRETPAAGAVRPRAPRTAATIPQARARRLRFECADMSGRAHRTCCHLVASQCGICRAHWIRTEEDVNEHSIPRRFGSMYGGIRGSVESRCDRHKAHLGSRLPANRDVNQRGVSVPWQRVTPRHIVKAAL